MFRLGVKAPPPVIRSTIPASPAPAPVLLVEPPALPVRPLPVEIRAETYALGEYEALCVELGVHPAKLLETKLLQFMAKAGMQTYPLDQVGTYLSKLAPRGEVWYWAALRTQDGMFANRPEGYGPDKSGDRVKWVYGHPVPLAELRKVKTINDEFNSGERPQVGFFVSDYAVPNPDPFIMVVGRGFSPIVFGVWDEPGFGL
jgi:hypothetical protein